MKKIIILIAVLVSMSAMFQPLVGFAISQITEPIIIKDVLRSSEITKNLILSNSEDKEVIYQLRAEGEIADWTSFYKTKDKNFENSITEIQIPAKSRISVNMKFKVPEDVPNGEYTGEAVVMVVPEKDKEESKLTISVSQRIGRKISIIVTDKENLELEITIISLKDRLNEDESLKIKVIYNNQGNISVKPDFKLKITKDDKTVFNAIFPYPENESPVRPLERKVFSSLVEWKVAGQEYGRYAAETEVLLNDKVIHKSGFNFRIEENVSDANDSIQPPNFFAGIGGGNTTAGYFLVGGFIAIFLFIVSKKIKKVRKQV